MADSVVVTVNPGEMTQEMQPRSSYVNVYSTHDYRRSEEGDFKINHIL